MPDEVLGERVCAVATLRPGQPLTVAALREWARGELADYKLPVELVQVAELPRNPSGKVIKAGLSALKADPQQA